MSATPLLAHTRLRRVDYSDVFHSRCAPASERTAEAWMRRMFEDAPVLLRGLLLVGWRLLGVRLGPSRSRGYVLGWRIDANESTWIRLAVESRIGVSADLVLHTAGSTITVSTFVQQHNRAARAVWSALIPIHRRTLGHLFRRATDPLAGRRLVVGLQRRVVNPVVRRIARYLPGEAVLETTGRRSGLLRRTPVGGRLDGRTFWIVSEFGRSSNYVRNLAANPNVRLELRGSWHNGVATILDDDDARARLRRLPWLNSLFVRIVGTELLTIRVDLTQ